MPDFNEVYAAQLGRLRTSLVDGVADFKKDVRSDIARLDQKYDALRAEMLAPGSNVGRSNSGGGLPGFVTPGSRLIKDGDIDLLRKSGRLRFQVDSLWPRFEQKTLIDSVSLGYSTPGALNAERVSPIVPLPRRRLVVRDLLRSKPITSGAVDWIQELLYTNAASPQEEGYSKQESADTFRIASERVRTLAHFVPLSRQVLDDLPELRRFIDDTLLYGLKVVEEYELLFGDGSADHLTGVCHSAQAYIGSYNKSADTPLDRLRHAILELEADNCSCTGFVLNPKDVHDIDLLKTQEGGQNFGSYIVGDPLGDTLQVRTLWGRAIVSTTVMPAGKFLAGNFAQAVIGDRMGAVIDVSENVNDSFLRNKLYVRCEERLSLCCLDSGRSFRYGDLA